MITTTSQRILKASRHYPVNEGILQYAKHGLSNILVHEVAAIHGRPKARHEAEFDLFTNFTHESLSLLGIASVPFHS